LLDSGVKDENKLLALESDLARTLKVAPAVLATIFAPTSKASLILKLLILAFKNLPPRRTSTSKSPKPKEFFLLKLGRGTSTIGGIGVSINGLIGIFLFCN